MYPTVEGLMTTINSKRQGNGGTPQITTDEYLDWESIQEK